MTSLQEVEKTTSIAEKIYPFAHALLPDELLAHQLVMDGLSRTFLILIDETNDSLSEVCLDWKLVCANVFDLAKKRSEHATLLRVPQKEFFKMGLNLRAALFLKHRYQLGAKEASNILGVELTDFFSFLHQGREFLIQVKEKELKV